VCAFHFACFDVFVNLFISSLQHTGIPCNLHPSSALFGMGYTPEYVVYHELVFTTKSFMRTVTAVDPVWLAELGPMFFSIKDDKRDALDAKSSAKEQARLMEVEFERKLELERKIQEENVARELEAQNASAMMGQVAAVGASTSRRENKKLRRVVTKE
jgi:pre-mRNA-splicing factor ATP-dependent RNA helicase DHX38/PRP16